jgi:membrane protease YdiL (CAAX protease family)
MAIWGYFDIKKYKDKILTENEKVKNYREGILVGWIPVLILIPIFLSFKIKFNEIGFRRISFNYNIWFTLITLIICIGFLVFLLYQMISYLVSEKYREKIKEEILKPKNRFMYNLILPHTFKEKRYFLGICLTAGIVEEIVFRGFLLYILQGLFPNFSIAIIIIIAFILFGAGHLYQGIGGVFKTALVGGIICCLYLVTNSLVLSMIIHFIMDFSSAFIIKDEENSILEKQIEKNK